MTGRQKRNRYFELRTDIKASAQGRAPAAIVCQTLDEFIVKVFGEVNFASIRAR